MHKGTPSLKSAHKCGLKHSHFLGNMHLDIYQKICCHSVNILAAKTECLSVDIIHILLLCLPITIHPSSAATIYRYIDMS